MAEKTSWQGTVLSVQPRIKLLRSFDQRNHSYLGYTLLIQGRIGESNGEFLIAIGKAAQEKYKFQAGDVVSGVSQPVADSETEAAEFYKTSGLKLIEQSSEEPTPAPPWKGIPPELPVYRERGHRRLDARTYQTKCLACIWGCRMPVEMIIDQWNPSQKKYRFETFCYGPKSCSFYRAGPTRKVSGRKGMSWEEEDSVDEDATSHRGPDD